MIFTQVETILKTQDMDVFPITALIPNRHPYTVLTFQPTGEISVFETGIKNTHRDQIENKLNEFLKIAQVKNVDIVVAPEYSTPKSTILKIINNELEPKKGALWLLGCESLTYQELEELSIAAKDENIWVYHEPLTEENQSPELFFNFLLYTFWAKDVKKNDVLCFLIQFKNIPCKDGLDIEVRKMYCGNTIYRFNDSRNSISLIAIICSDVYEFKEHLKEHHSNTLIIHIQQNPKPNHDIFVSCKKQLCSIGTNNNTELLSINWASKISYKHNGNENIIKSNFHGSSWLVSESKFKPTQNLIDSLHRKGLYYCLFHPSWHAFYFNDNEQILLIQKQKIFALDYVALDPKTCITVIERHTYNNETRSWELVDIADDGFQSLLKEYDGLDNFILDVYRSSPMAVECILELLTVPTTIAKNWHNPSHISSFQVSPEDYSLKRITYTSDYSNHSCGGEFRRARLQRAHDIISIDPLFSDWPERFNWIKNGFVFIWSTNDPLINICSNKNRELKATLIFLGDNASIDMVNNAVNNLKTIIQRTVFSLGLSFEASTKSYFELENGLCIFFRQKNILKRYKAKQSITDIPASATSILCVTSYE